MVVVHKAPWERIMREVAAIKKLRTRVGVIGAGASASEEGGPATVAEVASFHEFGTEAIPERSFIRRTFYVRAQAEMRKMCAGLSRQVVEGKLDPRRAIGMLGAWGAAQVKNTITQTDIPPPLAPATIAAREKRFGKASTKPLVATGQLLAAITWDLTEEQG